MRLSHRPLFKALSLTLLLAAPVGMALAQQPTRPAKPTKEVAAREAKDPRPNLTAAQKLVSQAFDALEIAEKANEYDTEGHAQKARDLLKTANDEIKLAAEAAKDNANPRKTARN
jgi:hypothetical protein